MTLNEELKQLMALHNLSQEVVSEYTGYSVETVKAWRSDPSRENKRYREMKPRAMKTLKFELKDRKIA